MSDIDLRIEKNKELAKLTTIGLGGPARFFVEVESVEELQAALDWADGQELPVYVLGGGSNTIFLDEGFGGVVVKVALRGVAFEAIGNVVQVTVAAGEDWDYVVAQAVEQGLAGLECLSGIPGLVGATPVQNVGAYGQEVAEVVHEVRAYDQHTKEIVLFTAEECEFAYRQSRFKGKDAGRYVIVEVVFDLRPGGVPTLRYGQVVERLQKLYGGEDLGEGAQALQKVRAAVLSLREQKSMVIRPGDPNAKSCGSFFVNPIVAPEVADKIEHLFGEKAQGHKVRGGVKLSAAFLVEQAGFGKGYGYKGVGISENHSLALINRGGTTQELLELQEMIQRAVQAKFDVHLEREPILVG